jgi:hypothetical protein
MRLKALLVDRLSLARSIHRASLLRNKAIVNELCWGCECKLHTLHAVSQAHKLVVLFWRRGRLAL